MQVRIVRIFNTYGPNMRLNDGRAVPNFMVQALRNKPVTVYGDGSQTRSLCYVSDLIDGIYRLLGSGLNEPVNIGNPRELTLLELAKMVRAAAGAKSRIVFKPLPVDDPRVRKPDISLARRELAWRPKVSLEEGLRKTVYFFRSKIK
jgi:dTDP-glucose 4,6-dehydratase